MTPIVLKPNLEERVREIMMDKLALDRSQLDDNADFQDDLGIDSLDILELRMELEKEFHITIDDEEAEKLRTVGSLSRCIKVKLR